MKYVPLNIVQNEIQLLSRVLLFMASLFIEFLVEKYIACKSRKSDFGWHRLRFSPCWMSKRVEKSEAILALLDSFQCISKSNQRERWGFDDDVTVVNTKI